MKRYSEFFIEGTVKRTSRKEWVIVLILLSCCMVVQTGCATVWSVGPSGCDFTDIQAAIDAAAPGDTIEVYKDYYPEILHVSKPVILRGVNIDGGIENMPVIPGIDLTADGITLDGFAIAPVNSAGIYVHSADNSVLNNIIVGTGHDFDTFCMGIIVGSINNSLVNNTVWNTLLGITLADFEEGGFGQNATLVNNTCSGNGLGIFVTGLDNVLLNNTVTDSYYAGIGLLNTENAFLSNNKMSNNTINFGVLSDAGQYSHYIHSIDSSNTVDGKEILYIINQHDFEINSSTNAGIIYCIECSDVIVRDVTLDNGPGVFFLDCTDSQIENVTSFREPGMTGIYFQNTTTTTITNSSLFGIMLESCSGNTIADSVIRQNYSDKIDLLNSLGFGFLPGITFSNSNNCIVRQNRFFVEENAGFTYDVYGIQNSESSQNQFDNNVFEKVNIPDPSVKFTAFKNSYSDENRFYRNRIGFEEQSGNANNYAFYNENSYNNIIYDNIIGYYVENLHGSSNSWNVAKIEERNIIGGPNIGGNFWTGVYDNHYEDWDNDGLSNVPFYLNADNVDWLPLIEPAYRINPLIVKNTSDIRIHVYGYNFTNDMTVTLDQNDAPIVSAQQVVFASPSMIVAIFDLSSTALGQYNVSLGWPDTHRLTLPEVITIDNVPEGILFEDTHLSVVSGITQEYTVQVPDIENLFITLQKVQYSGDIHYNWWGTVSIQFEGATISSDTGYQDQIIHLVNPEPGQYTISVSPQGQGTGILRVWTALPELPDGLWIVDQIYRPFGSTYHQIEVQPEKSSLTFIAQAMGDWSRFTVYQGHWGNTQCWISSRGPGASLTIENPDPGIYIVEFMDTQMVTGESQQRDVMLKASTTASSELPPMYLPMISSITPSRGGNTGTVTMQIEGAWLDPNASVSLTQNGVSIIPALSVQKSQDKKTLTAVLDLTQKPAGSYSVMVTNPDGISVNGTTPFTIGEGGRSEFWTDITGRETIRVGRPATYIINYGNKGTLDMPAPLISLATDPLSSSVSIRFPPSKEWRQMSEPVIIIADGPAGNPGILPAGSSFSKEIEVKTEVFGEFSFICIPYGSDPISTPRTVESVIDAACPAPGIPLTFGRTYTSGFSSYMGPFGYGWVHTYDFKLENIGEGKYWGDWNYGLKSGDSFIQLYLKQEDRPGIYLSQDEQSYLSIPGVDLYAAISMKDGSGITFLPTKSIHDSNGNRVTLGFTDDKLTTIYHSDGDQFSLEYGPNGRIVRLIDQAGKQTLYSYNDDFTLLTSVTAPDGSITRYTYDEGEAGYALTEITYPGGFTQTFKNDGDLRLFMASLNNKDTIPLSYNEEERTTRMSDALGSYVTVKVNEAGQPIKTENARGAIELFSYNPEGNIIKTTDPLGNIYDIEYDDKHNPVSITNPLGHTTVFSYNDQFNKVGSLIDARLNTIHFNYDDTGNLVEIIYPDLQSETLMYDDNGNIIQKSTRKGDVINYQYNLRGQVTHVDYPDGSFLSYTYDNNGNILTASNQQGTVTFEYNAQNHPIRIQYPDGNTFNYTYNDAGFLIERIEKDGYKTVYSYDDTGNLISVSDGTGNVIVTYSYDLAGKLIRKAIRNGGYTTYSYDLTGMLQYLVNYNGDGTVLSRFEYAYDLNGNPSSIDTTDGLYEYEYDAIGQLEKVSYPDGRCTQYIYDAARNRISVIDDSIAIPYTTNDMNQYTGVGDITFDYDANGNLVQKIENGKITSYYYDYESRLTKVISQNGTWEYTYDVLGNRIGVKENDKQTWYNVDPLKLGEVIAEYDEKDLLIARYTYGLGLVSKIDSGGNEFYYYFNPIGHTSQITNFEGMIVNQYRYSPSGNYTFKAEEISNLFTFVGEDGVIDDNNGLYFMQMRYYSPLTGQYISPDPTGIQRGYNLYNYAGNHLTLCVDPLGLEYHPWWKSKKEFINTVQGGQYEIKQPDAVGIVLEAGAKQVAGGIADIVAPGSSQIIDMIDTASTISNAQGESSKSSALLPIHMPKYEPDPWLPGRANRLNNGLKVTHEYHEESESRGFTPTPGWTTPSEMKPYKGSGNSQTIHGEQSEDPEDKFGPTGFDPAGTPRDQLKRYIAPGTPLTYRIDFWDAETATASVCDVWAYDQLDSDLNWSTFEFTSVGFTNWTVPLDGAPSFEVYVDTQPDMDYIVRISGHFNPETGNITLEYNTLDPVTLETPEDPLAGFLPPIVSNEIGWFEFTVEPDTELTTGTRLENQAWVKFDNLDFFPAPPDGPWVNTIDAGPPSSSVSATPQDSGSMLCSLSGSDNAGGSGIRDYTIYVSDNGGPYQAWLNHVREGPVTLYGIPGHTYGIYSLSRDQVGLNEDMKSQPDSTLTVPFPPVAPFAHFTVSPDHGSAPLEVQFTDTSENEPDEWRWNFGDGSAWMNGSTRNPIHTYTGSGTFTATLVAVNDAGSDMTQRIISIESPPPVASFTATPTTGNAPLTVQFNDTSTNNPTTWNWSFGDGTWFNTTDVNLRNTTHLYPLPGTYVVNLTVSNAGGSNTTIPGTTITVRASSVQVTSIKPDSGFTTKPLTNVNIGGKGFKKGLKIELIMPGQSPVTGTSIRKVSDTMFTCNFKLDQAQPGIYDVVVTNTNGDSGMLPGGFRVKSPQEDCTRAVKARYTYTLTAPKTIQFTDMATGYPEAWLWDFGDGTNSTEPAPVHTYTATGKYTVVQSVMKTDCSGHALWAAYTKKITIR